MLQIMYIRKIPKKGDLCTQRQITEGKPNHKGSKKMVILGTEEKCEDHFGRMYQDWLEKQYCWNKYKLQRVIIHLPHTIQASPAMAVCT